MTKSKRDIHDVRLDIGEEKARNNLAIFGLLKDQTGIAVSTISDQTGIAEQAVAENINASLKKDLLKISGSEKTGIVEFNTSHKKVLGAGFSGDSCVLTAMDIGGNVLSTEKITVEGLSGKKIKNKDIAAAVDKISRDTGLKGMGFCRLGIAIPRAVSIANHKAPMLFAEGLSETFKCSAVCTSEAVAAGYGEMDKAGGCSKLLYMHSDIGIGVIIKDEMIFEARNDEGKDDEYLRPWEQFDIVETAKALVNKGLGTDMVNMVNGDIEKISLAVVLQASQNKDELAEDLVKRSGLALGVRAAYLVNMFMPEQVIVGGGVEGDSGGFIGFLKESAGKFLAKEISGKIKIIPAILGEQASSMGAALLCRRELFMEV